MRNFLLAIMLVIAVAAKADSYTHLVVEGNDGTTTSFALSGLTITFSDGNFVASTGTTLTLADLAKMYFRGETNAIDLTTTNADAQVKVYNPGGQLVSETTQAKLAEQLSTLPKGIYLINNGETTKKVMVK